jgi:hypothetical protein
LKRDIVTLKNKGQRWAVCVSGYARKAAPVGHGGN